MVDNACGWPSGPSLMTGSSLLRAPALVPAILVALALTSPALAETCGVGSYAYAGVGTRMPVGAASATITPAAVTGVRDGHVAAWVGVGGVGAGPGGSDAWLQIGYSAFRGDATSRIYYEVALPGGQPVYQELRVGVPLGEAHTFSVAQLVPGSDWWQARLDGAPAGPPAYVAGSHSHWTAQVVGESWAGSTSGACNAYAYSFTNVAVRRRRTHAWAPLTSLLFQDPGYAVLRSSPSSFVASSKSNTPLSQARRP
jgi:hypothetical protein